MRCWPELQQAGKFAPCGVYKLVHDGSSGGAWVLEATGDDNTGHVTANAPTTYARGFPERREPKWAEARRREGPA